MEIIQGINGVLWGPWAFFVLMGAGILFTIWTKFTQYRALTHGVQVIRGIYDDPSDPGAINHFQALSAALSATVGLGNIGGVALAIAAGGPGALFWMWVIGFQGMAQKTIENTLAMMYRNTDDPDNPHGGAMWVIKETLGKKGGIWAPIATAIGGFFCITLIISTMTGGNMFQAWNVAQLTESYFGVPELATSIVLAGLIGMVIIGGIKRIGNVAGRLVPFMIAIYIVAGLAVIAVNIGQIPNLLWLIVTSAFSPTEGGGAFIGAGIGFAFSIGLRRALFSNEAGQGSAPIAHAAAKTNEPAREGVVGGLGPFIDTILVCTLTALVILSTGTWNRDYDASGLGNFAITGSDGVFSGEYVDGVHVLPELEMGEWRANDGLYTVATLVGADNPETGRARIKFNGEIAVAAEGNELGLEEGAMYVEWEELDLSGWEETPSALLLEGDGAYRFLPAAQLTAFAFDRAFPGLGKWLVTLAAWLFAFSTMISWSYYGEQGIVFLVGDKGVMPYKLLFLILVIIAPMAAGSSEEIGALIDFGTGWMLWANLPIVLAMGYLAVNSLSDYFKKLDAGEFPKHEPPSVVDVIEGHDVEEDS